MLHYNITFKLYFSLLLFAISPLSWADESGKPLLITTTKPMAIIAKSALQGNARVEFILPSGQSPHKAAITVSGLRTIAEADLVLWIGPTFEARAAKHLLSLPKEKLLTGMELIYPTSDQQLQNKGSDYAEDPHIWLSPRIANRVARALQQAFNLPEQDIITEQQQAKIAVLLKAAQTQNYIFHHDSIGYFVDAFNLQPPLTIRNSMGEKRGAKSQHNLRQQALQRNARCVFVETHNSYKDALRIARDLKLPLIQFDVHALNQPLEKTSYQDYMHTIAEQFRTCFQ